MDNVERLGKLLGGLQITRDEAGHIIVFSEYTDRIGETQESLLEWLFHNGAEIMDMVNNNIVGHAGKKARQLMDSLNAIGKPEPKVESEPEVDWMELLLKKGAYIYHVGRAPMEAFPRCTTRPYSVFARYGPHAGMFHGITVQKAAENACGEFGIEPEV